MKVRDLMSTDVITLHADSQMVDAEELMGFRRLRHLPVVDGKKLVGLVTHRVLLRHYLSTLEGKTWMEHQIQKGSVVVRKMMHDKVKTIGPNEDLKEAARIIHETKFGCLPVIDEGGDLVGIITEADFVHLAQVLLEHIPAPEAKKLLDGK